jgi:hypothetical protein
VPLRADFVKAKIDAVRAQIGRDVVFHVPTDTSDFTASGFYDPMSDTSFIKTIVQVTVLARVHWAADERIHLTMLQH